MLLARIAALLLPAFALAAETNDEEFRQLTADTFKPSVANGAW
jgi:hypothetical protein